MASRQNNPPKCFCSKSRVVMIVSILVVTLIYVVSSNVLNFKPKSDPPPRNPKSPLPVSSNNNPSLYTYVNTTIPHHYIGHEHLAAFSLDDYRSTPCERTPNKHRYDFHGNDSLVVIHIQKTGGSDFLRHVITVKKDNEYLCVLPDDILQRIEKRKALPKGRKEKVSCPRDPSTPKRHSAQWLISEKTMGWKCGVHPTLTEYEKCLPDIDRGNGDQRIQHHYMTFLRHPVLRYLSEFEHVARGAHWSARKLCGGKKVTDAEMPPCYPGFYDGDVWKDLTLTKFMECESNWAINRQVLGLADLTSVGCYNQSHENRTSKLLESAKCNLEKFAFFGLTEYHNESCKLFESVFNATFTVPLDQRDLSNLHSAPILQSIWKRTYLYDKIARINSLDMQLYEHALKLFARRVKAIGLSIDLQKVDHDIREIQIEKINLNSMKFQDANFDLPNE